MAVVGSTGAAEELFELERLSRSSTHATVWAAADSALATDCDGVLFKSLCTVANADWAVVRLPELRALPNAAISVAICELPDALDVELLLAAVWL